MNRRLNASNSRAGRIDVACGLLQHRRPIARCVGRKTRVGNFLDCDSPMTPDDESQHEELSDAEEVACVVLYHFNVDAPHFDLMWEAATGGPLTTLRCPHWPPQVGDRLVELPEHRRIYLEFQGDLTGDRGTVRRVWSGRCSFRPLTIDPPAFALRLRDDAGGFDISLGHDPLNDCGWNIITALDA
jgi:hypothetical protein